MEHAAIANTFHQFTQLESVLLLGKMSCRARTCHALEQVQWSTQEMVHLAFSTGMTQW